MSKNRLICFWAAGVLLTALFLYFKLAGSYVIESLYQQGHFEVLNFLANSSGHRPLDYYLGQVVDVTFGPLSVAITGILLISISHFTLKDSGFKKFALAIFCFLLASKFDVLFNPPYGDPIVAQLAEGIWLAQNHFDYIGLYHQPTLHELGYFITIYPAFIGILYLLISNIKIFLLVNHLIAFALGAGIISFLREMMRPIFGDQKPPLKSKASFCP